MKNCYIKIVIVLLCFQVLFILPAAASGDACALTVLSIPDGAAVSIDGTLIGTAPQRALELSCGNHSVIIGANGYADFLENITLKRGNPQVIIANLRRLEDRGTILIKSDPPGGDLYVDGVLKGTTPVTVDALTPGPHAILIRKTNYEDYRDVVSAGPGMIPEYNEVMTPLPYTGFLGIVSAPAGGTAYLDGTLFGTTPSLLVRVAAGNHTLLIQKEGYKNYTHTIEVAGGTSMLAQADLEKIPDEGTLIVDSAPSGAELYLNGTYKTVTPVTFEHVPMGNYTLEFRKPNYTAQNISFILKGGETLEVYALLGNSAGGSVSTVVRSYSTEPDTDSNQAGMTDTASPPIDRTFTWFSQGHKTSVTLHIPEDLYTHYKTQPHPTNGTGMSQYALSDRDRVYLHDLIGQLKDVSGSRNLAARSDYHNVVAFVQSIAYADDIDPQTGQKTDYWQYPIETLALGKGDCEDTAILTAALLREMDYDVAVVLLPGHAAVAVACDNCNGYYYPLNGRKYYYLETTGAGFSLGSMNFADGVNKYANTAAQVYVL